MANNYSKARKKNLPLFLVKRLSEGSFLLVISTLIFILLALITHCATDPGWFADSRLHFGAVANAGGKVGSYLADALLHGFGYFSFLLPISFSYLSCLLLLEYRKDQSFDKKALRLRSLGLMLFFLGCTGFLSLRHNAFGGVVGDYFAKLFLFAFNFQGAILFLLALTIVGITLLTGLSWLKIIEFIGMFSMKLAKESLKLMRQSAVFILRLLASVVKLKPNKEDVPKTQAYTLETPSLFKTSEPSESLAPLIRPITPNISVTSPILSSKEPAFTPSVTSNPIPAPLPSHTAAVKPMEQPVIPRPTVAPISISPPPKPMSSFASDKPKMAMVEGTLPPLTLLDKGSPGKPMGGYTNQELETVSREVEQHLLDFGIHADVVAVHPGPVITRFELQLAAGIKVSRLTTLSKDLARSLSVISVRVVEVIPGKTVVGLELPNQFREIVRLHSVLAADVYQQAQSPLTLALGVDIAGYPMIVDLAKMPHLLVAGTTGSGKSVGINAMILSLLFKATPQEVRLIMIDPKMLELSVYDGIPHLLCPVVTDMKEAASSLRWAVAEMERRYRLMSALGVRNLAGFNVKVKEHQEKGEPLTDPIWKPTQSMEDSAPLLETLPYIVIIIDELADLMMVVGKKVEQLIARIAQKARAAGIHLILATQRPSVDVLTGLIKSNIPTRMSFQVSSKIDSRTILDQQGAEQLLGHGDMLYLAPGTGAPLRVHGAYVDDREVHQVADEWRSYGEPDYIEEITQISEASEGGGSSGNYSEDGQDAEDADPLYDQAVEFVIQTRKASISAVQRRFRIGYNRAARLVEEMERTGVVGPLETGNRDILISTMSED